MNHSRRVRSPSFGYDPRMLNRIDARGPPPPGPEYDDPYGLPGPFEPSQTDPFMDSQPLPTQYHRLPSAYRTPAREQFPQVGPAPYKILCITNINPKVGDGPVKDALTEDFGRFGDVSVSICHDSGERLAYIYFRNYEEAREARHTKSRSILFDRPIEIEPIYEPRTSPIGSPPPSSMPPLQPPMSIPQPTMYARRRSITPPDPYYDLSIPMPPEAARPPPGALRHQGMSPPGYPQRGYAAGPGGSPPPLGPSPGQYGDRYPLQPPESPYASPSHDPYRSGHFTHIYPPPPGPYSPYNYPYGPPTRERERSIPEGPIVMRSPRHEPYYPPIEHRGYPSPPSHNHQQSRSSYPNSAHYQPPQSPMLPRHQSPPVMSPYLHNRASSSSYQSPPHQEPPQKYMSREFRREKFEGHTNHPDDSRPSRVLIVNNIDATKSESDVRNVFESYGVIEDIEIRKIGPDISSGLIKFTSMDAAYKAKTATNGRYIGMQRCRIIYGKVHASRKLWIGGLNPSSTLAGLEDEVSRFGEVISLDYTSGRPYAYCEYESANQAQFAAHHLKAILVPAAERKIRIEFVDTDKSDKQSQAARHDYSLQTSDATTRSRTNEPWTTSEKLEPSPQSTSRKRSITPSETINSKRLCQADLGDQTCNDYRFDLNPSANSALLTKARSSSVALSDELNNNQDLSRLQGLTHSNHSAVSTNEVNHHHDHAEDIHASSRIARSLDKSWKGTKNNLHGDRPRIEVIEVMSLERLQHCSSIREVVHNCPVPWFGQLVLRNFIFPSRIFMCSGRRSIVEKYLIRANCENGDQHPVLKITQRWRLHPQPKLEEVKRRMQLGNLGMLIITSRPEQSPCHHSSGCKTPQSSNSQSQTLASDDAQHLITQTNGSRDEKDNEKPGGIGINSKSPSSTYQSRPLKNLISYLEQKDAAGVISLNSIPSQNDTSSGDQGDGPKLLYVFPPGDFALNLIRQLSPKILPESSKEEFLLGVIIGSNETKV